MKKIVFYNHFKNGDIHLSRGFVKYFINNFGSNLDFFYYHRNSPYLLHDISNLQHITDESSIPSHLSGHTINNNTVFINTWYGCDNYKYIKKYGLNFDALFANFNDACKLTFGFELDQNKYLEYFPTIDFNQFEISKAKEFVKKTKETSNKLILVANGPAHSGQATNFNLSSVVENLAKKYQGLIFLLTDDGKNQNKEQEYGKGEYKIKQHNVFYTSDIIGKTGNDLNENAWLGSQSDFIIGRASGVFSFCVVKEIVFSLNTSFISFSNLDLERYYWLGPIFENKIKYVSNMHNYNCHSSEEAFNIINKMFVNKYGGI